MPPLSPRRFEFQSFSVFQKSTCYLTSRLHNWGSVPCKSLKKNRGFHNCAWRNSFLAKAPMRVAKLLQRDANLYLLFFP